MGVEVFLKFAKWKLGGKKCPCPCKKCRNRYWLTYKDVEHHLVSNGIEKSYCVWTLHGEDLSNIVVHPPMVANIGEITIGDVAIEMEGTEEETIGEVGIGMGNFVDSSFRLHERVVGDGSLGPEFDEPYVPEPDLGKRYYEYKKKATEKLYPACEGPETTLSALVELHNVNKQFGWSGTGMIVLLSLLRRWLPKDQTKVKLADFGLASEGDAIGNASSRLVLTNGWPPSFSIVLWELLINLTPFKGMTSIQAAYAVASRSNKYMMMSMAGNGGMNGSNIGNVRNGGAASISATATAIDHTRFPHRRERNSEEVSMVKERVQ
ncbi:hypothetical protein IFM89_039376 [Coptis chinensis]|uniref:Transposase-associated domain-containing protein n=1 Tax=Coptis chinensis TaxID=261450 RepID=A0A835H3B1_9MAGN|nr:hypothetical protein IFM89_039376 [Coptis chinensis]